MKYKASKMVVSGLVLAAVSSMPNAYPDAMSPGVKDTGKVYSKTAPDTAYFGTGIGGRYMEASALRLEIDRNLQDAEYDEALIKARKACQLDPTGPENHLLLAKALTKKLSIQDGPIDEKMLGEAMAEWKVIWLHDADNIDQGEAKFNYLHLRKIANALLQEKIKEAKERQKAKLAVAKQTAKNASRVAAGKPSKLASDDDIKASNDDGSRPTQIADKRKRFVLF